MNWLEWLLAPWMRTPKQVSDLWAFVLDETDVTTEALLRSEAHMSEIDNALSELDVATNKVADAQAALADARATSARRVADAQAALAALDESRAADDAPVAEPVADTNDEGEPRPPDPRP